MNLPRRTKLGLSAFLIAALLAFSFMSGTLAIPSVLADSHGGNGCQLASGEGSTQHVIYIQFDNLHFTRDNPNVPSDLEQMPALLNFMEQNGILMTNHQTPLISHTANDILTSLTGVYPSNLGQAVANSYGYFNPSGTVSFASSFTYWTDKVGGTDSNYNLLTASGQNAPAPWVAYTRAGCNFGVYAIVTGDSAARSVALEKLQQEAAKTLMRLSGAPGSRRSSREALREAMARGCRTLKEAAAAGDHAAVMEEIYAVLLVLCRSYAGQDVPEDEAVGLAFMHSPRLGLGLWFASEVRTHGVELQRSGLLEVDALLGLYFLSRYREEEGETDAD